MQLKDLIPLLFRNRKVPGDILFRVDAGRKAGLSFGHLFRCHALSSSLQNRFGCRTAFLMRPFQDGMDTARDLGENVMELSSDTLLDLAQFDAALMDLPQGPDPELTKALKGLGKWLVVIDDAGKTVEWANVVLNDSILAENFEYPSEAKQLLGPEYLILNEELEEFRKADKKRGQRPEVLLTFGGSDPTGLTVKILKALGSKKYQGLAFHVVLGPGYKDKEFDQAARSFSGDLKIHRNPESMIKSYATCDLLVCAGGRTLYEAWHLGLDCLPIGSAPHEGLVIQAFLDKGLVAGGLPKWDEQEFIQKFEQVIGKLSAP